MRERGRVVVIGAGVGGLSAAAILAARGWDVLVLEASGRFGGKLREEEVEGRRIDAGPTVLTMRPVFERIFQEAGAQLDDHVGLERASVLARHAWMQGGTLDLHADPEASAAAIEALAGSREADAFRRFRAHVLATWRLVEQPFLWSQRPTLTQAAGRWGRLGPGAVLSLDAHRSMWRAIRSYFHDPRLRQLFARYATYVGSSPFLAPATLNLIAGVEQEGVWRVQGGMSRLAVALAGLVWARGGVIRCRTPVSEILVHDGRVRGVVDQDGRFIAADAVLMNGAVEALSAGQLGQAAAAAVEAPRGRSLSAITVAGLARPEGLPLLHHNVLFGEDPAEEFADLFDRGRAPQRPTVYLCAQDRGDAPRAGGAPERMLMVLNAPANGDLNQDNREEIDACLSSSQRVMQAAGLNLTWGARVLSTPQTFATRFPETAGALYGAPSHGSTASFKRASARTRLPGLYLTGGGAHPGAGLPMVALSGLLACEAVSEDLGWTSGSPRAAISGGTSTS